MAQQFMSVEVEVGTLTIGRYYQIQLPGSKALV
jgi:hypothetical protein